MDLQKKIIGITVGIRFKRSFRIPEISGEIIDDILSGSKTPFGADFFPKMQDTAKEKVLFNPKTTEYLRINTDDLILGLEVNEDFEKKYAWLTNDVMKYFQDHLFKEYNLKNIRRIGVVFAHKIDKDDSLDAAVKVLTREQIKDVDNVNISFSKKLPALEALYRKGVSDYQNTIYNLTEVEGALLAELDYQYYYNPPPEDLRDCFIDKFFGDAKSFLEKNYYDWLTANQTKDAKS